MNKQIEEMAKAINNSDILCDTCGESTSSYCADAIALYLYNAGYRKASDVIDEFAERIKTFYHNLSGKTVGGSVAYHIDQIVKEMKGEQQ